MPDPATQPAEPKGSITYTDDHTNALHKNVAQNLQQAGVKTTYQAIKPVHVPDEHARNIVDQTQVDAEKSIPGSFKSTPETAFSPLKDLSEHLDYADQVVTGRSHVIDNAHRFTAFKNEKEDKQMEFKNTPKKDDRGPVKKFVDWLHH